MKLMKMLEYLSPVAGISLFILAFILGDIDYMLECMIALAVVSLLVGVIGYFSRRALERMRTPCLPLSGFRIDLATHRCGEMTIGAPLAPGNVFFSDIFGKSEIEDEKQGFKIGAKDGRLDYVFIDLERFPGIITRNGNPLPHLRYWNVNRVISELGDPDNRDEYEKETLLFYENGHIEIQIEFPENRPARFITIMRNPTIMFEPLERYDNSSVPLAGLLHLKSLRLRESRPQSIFNFRNLELPNFRTSQ